MSINFVNSEKLKLSVFIYEVTTLTTVITEDWIKILKIDLIIKKKSKEIYWVVHKITVTQ